jgi:hypothetical protein
MIPNNEELRRLIKEYIDKGGSYYRIGKNTGISPTTSITRFVQGKKDFHGKTYEILAKAIQ